jgi:DNA invertase Pin-like site-specific DNA recombinase
MLKLIAYYRVSTQRQGQSGLGLDAQRSMVERYAASVGGEIVRSYREVESGRKSSRPELLKAVAHARHVGGVLVIAKLDRLARNVAFTSALMESGLKFVACDVPDANEFTIHILAAMAQQEARMISERTKAALAELKKRGVKLGGAREGSLSEDGRRRRDEGLKRAREAARVSRSERAVGSLSFLMPLIRELRGEGRSLREVARRLNEEGMTTRRGGKWTAVAVWRAERMDAGGGVGRGVGSGAGSTNNRKGRVA